MKEAAAAVLVRHDVDRPAQASSASSESGSRVARAAPDLGRVGWRRHPAAHERMQQHSSSALRGATAAFTFHARTRTPHEGARVKVAVSCAAGWAQGRPSVAASAPHDSWGRTP